MDKQRLLDLILARLDADHHLFLQAAKSAHAAAVHSENIPDNKYATLGLEASYLAQGQADRAAELRTAIGDYRRLELQTFDSGKSIRLTALVCLVDDEGGSKHVFLGPAAGGLQLEADGTLITVITPGSPLGRTLLGKTTGDLINVGGGPAARDYVIDEIE
jgi:hypothetical protein